MTLRILALLATLATCLDAVGFRLATFNVGAHLVIPADGGPTYFDYGIGPAGQPDHDRVRDILARINPDVVALQEIHATDVSGNPSNLAALAAGLGYPYFYSAPSTGSFDTSLRVAFLSRFPFLSTSAIGSPAGAREITRLFPVVRVDVPATPNDPILISAHLKAGTTSADRFRRAVEMKRLAAYTTAQGLAPESNFVILGDFNPSSTNTTFTSLPSGLPNNFSLGADLSFPISYSTNMLAYFTTPLPVKLDPRQLNQSPSTFNTTSTTGPTLDLILVSPAIAGRTLATEIYNSTLDTPDKPGLAKSGSPPPAGLSNQASDHYAVFADLELDQAFTKLSASLSAGTVNEGTSPGSVTFTVTLPAIRPTPLTVDISSDDPSAAAFPASTLTLPAGTLSASISIITPRNFISDGTRTVALTAAATGYTPATAVLNVIDADPPYRFASAGQTLVENFSDFPGNHNPAPWSALGGTWRGPDDGSGTLDGFRSYGNPPDGSLGYLGTGATATVYTTFVNQSPTLLTSLRIGFNAEQWTAIQGGAANGIRVDLFIDETITPLPALAFTAATDLPTGPVVGGASSARSTVLTGLSVPPGESFDLRFTFTPAPGAAPRSQEIFINEFSYDNVGADVGEFVEIVAGPGYTGDVSNVSLVLYNGADGKNYGTHALSTFTQGPPLASGYRIFSKLIPGIQNGDPDGLALVDTGTVRQFISYGGTFQATLGPSLGMTSTPIGVKQTTSEVVGQASLGLTGTGSLAAEFTWTKFTGLPHSPGLPNPSQTFLSSPPPQGLAIDQLAVTFLLDTDGDGLPDELDPDDDNDGLSDADEFLFGTNPLNPSSIFRPSLTATSPTQFSFSFPTFIGRHYIIQRSSDMITWTTLSSHAGTGSPVSLPLTVSPAQGKIFYRVAAGLQK